MTIIYNKGIFRDRLWVKHLSPFLKRICNRRWRRTAYGEIKDHLEDTETGMDNPAAASDTTNGITQEQLDELNQLTSYGIDLVKDELIIKGTFLPVGFSCSDRKDYKKIVYKEQVENDRFSADDIYDKIADMADDEFTKEGIRITGIIYYGITRNDEFPDGIECISFRIRSKDFDGTLHCSYPVIIKNRDIFFGNAVIQWIDQ